MSDYCRNCCTQSTRTFYSYNECDNCGEPTGPVPSTKDEELRELIERWREGYDTYKRATDPETDIRANVLEQCADELEQVIDDE